MSKTRARLTVEITRVRFLESDVHDGAIPHSAYDSARTETVECNGWADAVWTLESEGATQWSTYPVPLSPESHGWFSNPDGAQTVDYGTGEMEEISARLSGPGAFRAWWEMTRGTAHANMYRRSADPVLGGCIADGWDGGDPYGSAMLALGAVCDVLFALDPNAIPGDWQFRPAMGQTQDLESMALRRDDEGTLTGAEDLTTAELAAELLAGNISEAGLVHAGNILSRFLDMLPEDLKY